MVGGLILLILWSYWLTKSVLFPRHKRKWLEANPAFSQTIEGVFSAYVQGRFSNLAKMTYAVWLCFAVSLIAQPYLSASTLSDFVSSLMFWLLPCSLFVSGGHAIVNARFMNLVPVINDAANRNYDIKPLLGLSTSNALGMRVAGVVMIVTAVCLTSCVLFNFPWSMSRLSEIMDK